MDYYSTNRLILQPGININIWSPFAKLFIIIGAILIASGQALDGQRAAFLPGGDMLGFTIPESTKVGSVVYQLKASNPGRGRLSYYISGDTFSVAKDSGAVTLIRPLDRETESTLDVIITIVDDSSTGSTLSIKREIKVADDNDNPPVWLSTPYKFAISESTKLFTTIIEGIRVSDADSGRNSQIEVSCNSRVTPEACSMFTVHSSPLNQDGGLYSISISLKGNPLNYEQASVHNLGLLAIDSGGLKASTNVTINVIDVQDEPPKFLNGPYSITVNESTPSGSSVLTIIVRDGDNSPSIRRDIQLEIIDDKKKYFALSRIDSDSWSLVTGNNLMDREDPEILLAGGIYSCSLRATELVPIPGSTATTFGATSLTSVTVVIQDINDQEPRFNLDRVNLEVPEDITNGSAVPSLNLIVSDPDAGHNAKFVLSIEDLDPTNPASRVFLVSPSLAMGRTPIILKVINSDWLDYEDVARRNFIFNIIAAQDHIRSTSFINLTLTDANDNQPIFDQPEYYSKVMENEKPGRIFYTVAAIDSDSGAFGRITYTLKGFGSDKFAINSVTGEISVADCSPEASRSYGSEPEKDIECLDYEVQPSYSLRVEATDGGGKRSTANLHIEIVDINDNVPKFQRALYVRELNEKDTTIYPPLILRATDIDGPTQGGTNGITYRVKWTNLTGLAIDPISGDVKLTQSIHANFTRNPETGLRKKLNYEAIIEAVDGGQPPLTAEAVVQIYVRSARDGEPMFVNEPYNATVKENAPPGTVVIVVKASDPDGPDAKLRYSLIAGAKDNFVIDSITGEVKVSSAANLDRDFYGGEYSLTVAVTDSGHPIPLTSTAQLTIIVEDVNNKPPKFGKDGYVIYLSDSQFVPGHEIMTIRATDTDSNAKIRYDLDLDLIKVRDKTGALVGQSEYFKNLLKIDPVSGIIRVNGKVDSERASIIVVPIVAQDINGQADDGSPTDQKAFADLTIYIQSHGERNPIFIPPWTPSEPTYEINLPEETLIGSTVFILAAKNPLTGKPITNFKKIDSTDPEGYFSVNKLTGVVTINRRIDFESLVIKQIKFSVEAVGQPGKSVEEYFGGEKFTSVANILVSVIDVNDNSPIFLQDTYRASVLETTKWPQIVLTVSATDSDSGTFGSIGYYLSGDGSDMFEIGNRSGVLRIRQGVILDRESKSTYNLQVTAIDNFRDENDKINEDVDSMVVIKPEGGFRGGNRKTTVSVVIELIDVNDNPPKFSRDLYEVIVPESAPVGSRAGSVSAIDPDEGRNGQVHYEIAFLENFPDPREELFTIDRSTGELFVNKSLSGKGRIDPYLIHITARDSGREPFSSHTKFSIIIGDIAANDGVPRFIRPAENEIIYLTENAKPGTLVYTVTAVDADSSNSPNGRVMYKFAEPSPYFDIDSSRGTITTSRNVGKTVTLDREKQENYTLILVAFDLGNPPQESQRIMVIRLNDTDDNSPQFNRVAGDSPMIWEIDEEQPIGSLIGTLKAIDDDVGTFSAIQYYINYESVEGAILIETINNTGQIKIGKRLDREEIESITLVVQARSALKHRKLNIAEGRKLKATGSTYNPNDLSQIEIKIILKDIDDNPPKFNQDYFLTGIRWDTPVHSDLLTFNAVDPDPTDSFINGNTIEYAIGSAIFVNGNKVTPNMSHVFDLGRNNGILRNDMTLKSFVGGYFLLTVEAVTVHPDQTKSVSSSVPVRILIIREKDFVKFVFNKSPNTVESNLGELKTDLEKALEPLSLKWSFNFQEAHFHERKDGSLDFEATSACFQILDAPVDLNSTPEDIQTGTIVSYKEALRSLKNNSISQLKKIYSNYGIVSIEECIKPRSQPLLSKQQLGIVLVAIFIACCTLLLTMMALNMRSDLKRKLNTVTNCVGIASQSQLNAMLGPQHHPHHPHPQVLPPQPIYKPTPFVNIPNQERIYEWQEAMNPQLDALSARSFPTLR